MKTLNARGIAISGILLAVSVVTLYLQTFLPVANFTIYMLSSFYVSAVIIEAGAKAGWLFYAASCILAFIFVPNKIFLVPYILFFGLYGILKFYIEGLNKRKLEIFLKIAYFNIILIVLIVFFKSLLIGKIDLPDLPAAILIIGFEAAFIAYDYCFTLVIDFYRKRIKR